MDSGYDMLARSESMPVIIHFDLLVMLGDAALALPTVFASQRGSDHARDAEVGFIEFPHS